MDCSGDGPASSFTQIPGDINLEWVYWIFIFDNRERRRRSLILLFSLSFLKDMSRSWGVHPISSKSREEVVEKILDQWKWSWQRGGLLLITAVLVTSTHLSPDLSSDLSSLLTSYVTDTIQPTNQTIFCNQSSIYPILPNLKETSSSSFYL